MGTFEEEYKSIWEHCDYELEPELIVLRAHLMSERYIERFIKLFLLKGDTVINQGRLTYVQKLNLMDSFGIVPKDLVDCHKNLNTLRNKMAHELGYDIKIEDVDLIGRPMGQTYAKLRKERGQDFKDLLCTVVGYLCGGLAYYVVEYEKVSEKKRAGLIMKMSRDKKQKGRLAVRCIVSDRWLSFPAKTETKLQQGEPVVVNVMTRSQNDKPKKICELILFREELEDTLRMIHYEPKEKE